MHRYIQIDLGKIFDIILEVKGVKQKILIG
jgi:hypothetical protein